jgi:hypothetical protein
MRSITIDILNHKAIKLLKELERLQIIRLREEEKPKSKSSTYWQKYKGSLAKQPLNILDKQLAELRGEWE